MAMNRLLNLSFTFLSDEHLEVLYKECVIDAETSIPSRKTYLPMIGDSLEPEDCLQIVGETIEALKPTEQDVAIVTGLPDVGHYVVNSFYEATGGKGLVLMPVGRMVQGNFNLVKFRKVIW